MGNSGIPAPVSPYASGPEISETDRLPELERPSSSPRPTPSFAVGETDPERKK